ncbi:MAG: hypothetical protein MJ252_18340 [archaeon]|nr:hypothetical protein [archaeon]
MDEDLQIFYSLLNHAEKNKQYQDVYMFLKDCAFKMITKINNERHYPQEVTSQLFNLYNTFQQEINMYHWSLYQMKMERYKQFLEYYYKCFNFDSLSIPELGAFKSLTENLQYLGQIDNLFMDRSKNIFSYF